MFFFYLVKSYLSNVRYCTQINLTSHFLQGTRNTWPFPTGHPVCGDVIPQSNSTVWVGHNTVDSIRCKDTCYTGLMSNGALYMHMSISLCENFSKE